MSGMIQPFWGEFLVSPSPLEWSLNYCSHACAYCFANLNSPTRKGDASKALRQIADIGRRKTLTDLYLRSHYPVCIANKTDPFSESNYRETLPVIEAMKEAGVPIQFQTKGGKGIDEALDGLPPSVWYITICMIDDAIRRKIEPNAPSIGERLDLADRLMDLGHHVVIGLNPAVAEWLPDPGPLMRELSDRGVWGVWMERLHLSQKQLMFMPQPTRRHIGEEAIKRSLAVRKMPTVDNDFIRLCRKLAEDAGLHPYTFAFPGPSSFFDVWREAYKATLPLNHDVVNFAFEEEWEDGRLVSFDDYVAILEGYCETNFFEGKHRIGDYMRVVSYRTTEQYKDFQDWWTFRELLYLAWINPRVKLSLAMHSNFAVACEVVDGAPEVLTDEKGVPYYVFARDGEDEVYRAINLQPEAAAA